MSLELMAGVVTLVGVGAITPGPNNIAVMNAAARAGVVGALPAIAGIVLGSLGLLLLVAAGAGAMLDAHPGWRTLLTVSGCLYLGYLGARLIANGAAADQSSKGDRRRAKPRDQVIGLFGFQFLNPKSWALVVTATSAVQVSVAQVTDLAWLAAIFVIIPTLCLTLWSLLGASFTERLARPTFRARFDRTMGTLLVASAVLLLVEGFRS
jgi:threonine/homoserine/homoserine lactone efflux protein